jgi:hypothetical protein
MMPPDTKHRFLELLSLLLEEKLSDSQFKELQQVLCTDAEARRIYRDYLAVDDRLASGEVLFTELERAEVRTGVVIKGWLPWAAAVVLVFTGVLFSHLFREQPFESSETARSSSPETAVPTKNNEGLAVLSHVLDVRWAASQRPLRHFDELQNEWIRLEQGVVQLAFSNGAKLSLEGPAALRIISEEECFVEKGKLVVLAPAQIGHFKVNTRMSEVVDLGTEFAMVVSEDGTVDVHVLEGEVEIGIIGADAKIVVRERLGEAEAVRLEPGQAGIASTVFNGPAFESLRAVSLWREQPLRIQFDCGSKYGTYQGAEAPAQAAGFMDQREAFWNPINGDQSGVFIMSDGTIAPYEIEIDYGRQEEGEFSWDRQPHLSKGAVSSTRGVFDTPLCKDYLVGGGVVGLRFRGMPQGTYRVFLVGRSVLDHQKWGNFLVSKVHKAVIAAGEADWDSGEVFYHEALTDPDAAIWVNGQTHVVTDIEITGSEQYLTVLTAKDRERSAKPGGGNSVISAIQIIELRDHDNTNQKKSEI